MSNPLARLTHAFRTDATQPARLQTRTEIAAQLAARLGVEHTPFDRPLLDARADRLVDYLGSAAKLRGAFLHPFPACVDADGGEVDLYSEYSGVPAEAWFPISVGDDQVGEVVIRDILGSDPQVQVMLGGRSLPTVSLFDEPALLELGVELGTTLRTTAR